METEAFSLDAGLWKPQVRSLVRTMGELNTGKSVCLFSPTGSGKTRMSIELLRWAKHRGVGGIFFVNRKLLIQQTSNSFSKFGLDHGIRAAEYDDLYDESMPFQISSADSERSRVYKSSKWNFHEVGPGGVVVVDECIDGDSLIVTEDGETPIKDAANSRFVLSECDGQPVWSRILGWKKTGTKETLAITFASGRKLICTANHLLMTSLGWMSARDITVGASVKCCAGAVADNMPDSETRISRSLTPESVEEGLELGTPTLGNGRWLWKTDPHVGVDVESFAIQDAELLSKALSVKDRPRGATTTLRRDANTRRIAGRVASLLMRNRLFLGRCLETPLSFTHTRHARTLDSRSITAQNSATGRHTKQGYCGGFTRMSEKQRIVGMVTGLLMSQPAITNCSRKYEHSAIQMARRLCLDNGSIRLATLGLRGGLQTTELRLIGRLVSRLTVLLKASMKSLLIGLASVLVQRRSIDAKKVYQSVSVRKQESQYLESLSTCQHQCTTSFDRVVSVESVGSRDVYDIEVEKTHRFFANGILVHNCHIQKSQVMKDLLFAYKERGAMIVLLTATPVEMGEWADTIVVGGKLSEWRACGALVPVYCYSISQPDLSKVKRNATGEYVLDDRKRKIFTQHIVGEVIENWERLNNGSPTMAYAPGVPESVWLTQEFNKRGHNFAHVDATKCVVDGVEHKLDRALWNDIMSRLEDGSITGLFSRFKAREGIDLPKAGHCVLATPVGSVASYLQIVGRVMRSAPGKENAILQDHGGVYHHHGSPNHDRDWETLWKMRESVASNEHMDRMREGTEQEPIRCSSCGMERTAGPKCPGCGLESTRSLRKVVMESGTIKEVEGDLIPKTRRIRRHDTEKKWAKMYFGFKRKGSNQTFSQMEAFFCKQHGYRPRRDLPFMPVTDMDWKLPVKDVPVDRLRRKEPVA